MKNIIIVDCRSTGINYIYDIIQRGYNPIVLENNIGYGAYTKENCEYYYNLIKEDFELIFEKDTYEETFEMVKKYNPFLILPGSDAGISLATRLANDLGLISNSYDNIEYMIYKSAMQDALAKAGIRHIKGKVISSLEEASEYYDLNDLNKVVIKPLRGICSSDVHICLNKDKMMDNISKIFHKRTVFGEDIDEVLIQEYIQGTEYVVNTVSSRGLHVVNSVWRYDKKLDENGYNIYDSIHFIDQLNIKEAELIEYAFEVADAIGIKYGPIHAEYIIDEMGPVLIEVNCRPCGTSFPIDFLESIFGHHETNIALDSYLNYEQFKLFKDKSYNFNKYGCVKFLPIHKTIVAESAPIEEIIKKLKSFYKIIAMDVEKNKVFNKTEHLNNCFATIYLMHEDKNVLYSDLNFLKSLEKNAFSQILSDGLDKRKSLNPEDSIEDVKNVLDYIGNFDSTLLVTDQLIDDCDVYQDSIKNLDKIPDNFDRILINLNESLICKNDLEIAKLIFKIIDKLKIGGTIFIPEFTYQYIVNGRVGIEGLILADGFKIKMPSQNIKNVVIGTKK